MTRLLFNSHSDKEIFLEVLVDFGAKRNIFKYLQWQKKDCSF